MKYIKAYELFGAGKQFKNLLNMLKQNDDLLGAIQEGNYKKMMKLIDKDNINYQDRHGNTPLIVACITGRKEIAEKLIELGADLNLSDFLNQRPSMGNKEIPLILAARHYFFDIVKLLIDAGADWNITDKVGQDFFVYLDEEKKQILQQEYPEKYSEYELKKAINKYNL